jgi:benzoyl-CoA reductase/2-hydroxyglutaryl-CoA dehydratase subunit BcrC/BadD/HgdB
VRTTVVSNTKKNARKTGLSIRKVGAVDAYVVNYPDLTSKLKYQNLLNHFIECINHVNSGVERDQYTEQLDVCIKHLEEECEKNISQFGEGVSATIKELISEAHQLLNLLKAFTDPEAAYPLDILLSAKSSHLQWLAVCLLEDLKIPLSLK